MMKDNSVYLHHIVDAIERVERHLAGITREEFFEAELVQDGVVRQLEIIGEAARNLPEGFREEHPDIPWGQIVGMRNRLIHAYFQVDLAIVWEIAELDLPVLRSHIESILGSKRGSGGHPNVGL
jgi:uncharacterized protein with HEPN domain